MELDVLQNSVVKYLSMLTNETSKKADNITLFPNEFLPYFNYLTAFFTSKAQLVLFHLSYVLVLKLPL